VIDEFLVQNLSKISKACEKNGVAKLYAFGSIVDGRFVHGKSDIDLLVEFPENQQDKKANSKNLLLLWMELQGILETKVDLVTTDTIKGEHFKKYLELYKELIYEKKSEYHRL